MKLRLAFLSVLLLINGVAWAQQFDKAEFYAAMKSGSLDVVNKEIETVKSSAPEKDKEGYEGALLMRKAGLLKKAKDRLNFFKQGRIKLETALLADNGNTEFHFLRLTIEEHAPRIVKYHSDIEKDKALVVSNFKELSPPVKHAILDYCENSKVLHKEEF
jgi:hypothetical protein